MENRLANLILMLLFVMFSNFSEGASLSAQDEEWGDVRWRWIKISKYVCVAEFYNTKRSEIGYYAVADRNRQVCDSIEPYQFSNAFDEEELLQTVDFIKKFRIWRSTKDTKNARNEFELCILKDVKSRLFQIGLTDTGARARFISNKCSRTIVVMTQADEKLHFEFAAFRIPNED